MYCVYTPLFALFCSLNPGVPLGALHDHDLASSVRKRVRRMRRAGQAAALRALLYICIYVCGVKEP